MKPLLRQIPLLHLSGPDGALALQPPPLALLVDIEGTLTGFHPSINAVLEAVASFDRAAIRAGMDLDKIHYVTNASFARVLDLNPSLSPRFHSRSRKPLYTPPREFPRRGFEALVIGDQYLTDGLLAWRFGYSFALVEFLGEMPLWPRLQLAIGHLLSTFFFSQIGPEPPI